MLRSLPAASLLCLLTLPAQAQDAPTSKPANEERAIDLLRVIRAAQTLFRESDAEKDGKLDYASELGELVNAELVSKTLADGEAHGYTFVVAPGKKSLFTWMAVAAPTKPGVTGDRYFATNHAGGIYHAREPIPLVESCEIKATPVGKPLPKRKVAEADLSPVQRALRKRAQEGGATRRVFVDESGERFLTVEVLRGEEWRVSSGLLDAKAGTGRLEQSRHEQHGELRELRQGPFTVVNMRQDPPKGSPAEGKLELRTSAGSVSAKGVYTSDMLPGALILFELGESGLELPLQVRALEDAFAPAQPKLQLEALPEADLKQVEGAKRGLRLGAGERWARLWLSGAGEALAYQPLGGKRYRSSSPQALSKVVMSYHKDAIQAEQRKRRVRFRELMAVSSLRRLGIGQTLFREGDPDKNGVTDYADDLDQLVKADLIDREMASGKKRGYEYVLIRSTKSPQDKWLATASPIGKEGRHFAINHEGVIHVSETEFALDNETCEIKGGEPYKQ